MQQSSSGFKKFSYNNTGGQYGIPQDINNFDNLRFSEQEVGNSGENNAQEVLDALRDLQVDDSQQEYDDLNCLDSLDIPKYNLSCYASQPNGQLRYLKNNIIGDISPEEIRFADYQISKQGEKQGNTEIKEFLTLQFQNEVKLKNQSFVKFVKKVKDQQASYKQPPRASFTHYQEFLYPQNSDFHSIEKWETEVKRLHGIYQKELQNNPNKQEISKFKDQSPPPSTPPPPSPPTNQKKNLQASNMNQQNVPKSGEGQSFQDKQKTAPFQYDQNGGAASAADYAVDYQNQYQNGNYMPDAAQYENPWAQIPQGQQFYENYNQYSSPNYFDVDPRFGTRYSSWNPYDNQVFEAHQNQQWQYQNRARTAPYTPPPPQQYQQQGYVQHQRSGSGSSYGTKPYDGKWRSGQEQSNRGPYSVKVEQGTDRGGQSLQGSSSSNQGMVGEGKKSIVQPATPRQQSLERKYVYLPIYEANHEQMEKKIKAEQGRILEQFNSVDLCFIIDATNSMQDIIDSLKQQIVSVVETHKREVCRYFPDMVRVAYICYRDFGDDVITEVLDFTNDVAEFQASIGQVKAYGGDDIPEDMISAIELVSTLTWQKNSSKVVCHIADAPCHGVQFHSFPINDNYKEGDYKNRSIENVLAFLYNSVNINHYNFLHLNRNFTGKMVKEFRNRCSRLGVRPKWFREVYEVNAKNLGLVLATQTLSSISSSLGSMTRTNASESISISQTNESSTFTRTPGGRAGGRGQGSARGSRFNTYQSTTVPVSSGYSVLTSAFTNNTDSQMHTETQDEEPDTFFRQKFFHPDFTFDSVNWDNIRYNQGTYISNEKPSTMQALLNFIKYKQPLTQYQAKTGIKIQKQPFSSSGACRFPFYAIHQKKEPSESFKYVVKQFKDIRLRNLKYYIQQMEISTIAEFMQRGFQNQCERKKLRFHRFCFVRCTVFLNRIFDVDYEKSKELNTDHIYNMERLLPGDCAVEKFNSNFGHINRNAHPLYSDLLQAFSHWTYEASDKTFVLVDLQGTFDEANGVMMLTDPAIHCPADKQRFARTNMAESGVLEFLKSHECNEYCQKLGIFKAEYTGRTISTIDDDDTIIENGQGQQMMNQLKDSGLFNY